MESFVVGVDVGTGSTRAGVFDASGRLLGRGACPIAMRRPHPDWAEQNSEQIWDAVCDAVRQALAGSAVDGSQVAGIGFDATCSLVARGLEGGQLPVSSGSEAGWDTIVWLDHRAAAEAEDCNRTGHPVLDFVGGVMSPEMQTPKLMWLKRHMPDTWARARYFFDLADYLTWKASGSLARSQCTLTCKWTYLGHAGGWQRDFFEAVGLEDMIEKGSLPDAASPVGADLGGLTATAADALGLTTACRVASGLIDAHAGVLGLLGAVASDDGVSRNAGLIAGTSTCLMALSSEARPTPGVWGPYFGAVTPDSWLSEGGQSATGALLDHLVCWHSAGGEPDAAMHQRICERIMELRREEGPHLAPRLHVLPDFHGNRSPRADAEALGVISGLTLDFTFDSLCRLYWRTSVSIALGVRHIVEALNDKGYAIDTLHVTGGHTKNPLLMELYADATGCDVALSFCEDAVLLGSGMAAASAAGLFGDFGAACAAMRSDFTLRSPNPEARSRFDVDYRVFLKMHEHRNELDRLGSGAAKA